VIDLIRERRAADPAMHVYHYAAYEVTALKRLTCEYGTREEELDELLRGEVFVDLYKVVSQGLRLSHGRYGLKQVETFFFERQADLRSGDDSIVLYEEWLERHDPQILDDIAAYNEEDCVSTLQLRDWLLPLRPGQAPELEEKEPRDPPEGAAETEELRAALLAGLPEDSYEIAEADRPRWLLAQLLLYHRREEKPVWWAFFDKIGRTSEELQERDSDAIGGVEAAGAPVPPVLVGDWSAKSGYELGRRLAVNPEVTAVFVGNDLMALGLLRALHEEGRELPAALSVVGFDDMPEAAYFTPPLTTVRQDFGEVGRHMPDQFHKIARNSSESVTVEHIKVV